MITTPSVPVVGTSGRPATVAAPAQQTNSVIAPVKVETTQAVKLVDRPDRTRQFIAERERAMQAKLSEQVVEAADLEMAVIEHPSQPDAPKKEHVEAIDLLPPPATEVLAKGGKQTRLEARAELFEAEARLRMLNRASSGYEESRSAMK